MAAAAVGVEHRLDELEILRRRAAAQPGHDLHLALGADAILHRALQRHLETGRLAVIFLGDALEHALAL